MNATGGPITLPGVGVRCPSCEAEVPVPVVVEITTHYDSDSGFPPVQRITADPDLTEVWAHARTHGEGR